MSAHRAHDVPLCQEAQDILELMRDRRLKDSDLVFPGPYGGVLSDVGVNKVLHGLPTVIGLDDEATKSGARAGRRAAHGATVHGMRSAARSWAAAQTEFAPFVAELALAHVNKDKVEAAYQRDSVLEKRTELMDAWGGYCRNSNVVEFARQATRKM
jgi:integrase